MRILDLYCCAGGASVGYNRAGFEVIGVDIKDQPNYPFPFIKRSALEVLNYLHGGFKANDGRWYDTGDFDAIHASPPCQSSSALTKGTNAGKFSYEDFIPETRRLLDLIGKPYVIENVQGSAVRRDMVLCGEMFGLAVIRHRYFEFGNWTGWSAPEHIKHRGRVAGMRHGVWYTGPYFAVYGEGGGKGTVKQWQDAMEMPWTNVRKEIAEAIPPKFTEYIGKQLRNYLLTGTRA